MILSSVARHLVLPLERLLGRPPGDRRCAVSCGGTMERPLMLYRCRCVRRSAFSGVPGYRMWSGTSGPPGVSASVACQKLVNMASNAKRPYKPLTSKNSKKPVHNDVKGLILLTLLELIELLSRHLG